MGYPPGISRKTSHPHSKGKVICDACFTTIPQGVQYRRDTWKDGTYHWSLKYCPPCWQTLPYVEDTRGEDQPLWAPDYEIWAEDNDTPGAHEWRNRAYPEE